MLFNSKIIETQSTATLLLLSSTPLLTLSSVLLFFILPLFHQSSLGLSSYQVIIPASASIMLYQFAALEAALEKVALPPYAVGRAPGTMSSPSDKKKFIILICLIQRMHQLHCRRRIHIVVKLPNYKHQLPL